MATISQLPNRQRSQAGHRRSDDSGITVPVVALFMIVLLGVAALVIDLGNGWFTRRSLIQATDAGALAAAQEFTASRNGCSNGTGANYVAFNSATATGTTCTEYFYAGGQQGRVTVNTNHNVQTWFSGVVGLGDYNVTSSTTAVWGPPATVTGLRPIGLCIEGSAALANMINNPPSVDTLIRIDYDKDQPNACGGASIPGNWGTVDFNGGGNTIKDMILYGYDGEVVFANHAVTTCNGGAEAHCYGGDTGALAGVQNELNTLRNSGMFFTLPVFNFVENPGNNAQFHLMGVLRVRLIGFQINGNPNNRYFDLLVRPGLITGTCCGGSGSGSGDNKVIAICGVDPNATSACDP